MQLGRTSLHTRAIGAQSNTVRPCNIIYYLSRWSKRGCYTEMRFGDGNVEMKWKGHREERLKWQWI